MNKPLNRLVGEWSSEATHPERPGVVIHGTVSMEWLEGGQFLIQRARTDNPEFPDSISMIGDTRHDRVDDATGAPAAEGGEPQLRMHYFDSRGVYRVLDAHVDDSLMALGDGRTGILATLHRYVRRRRRDDRRSLAAPSRRHSLGRRPGGHVSPSSCRSR